MNKTDALIWDLRAEIADLRAEIASLRATITEADSAFNLDGHISTTKRQLEAEMWQRFTGLPLSIQSKGKG